MDAPLSTAKTTEGLPEPRARIGLIIPSVNRLSELERAGYTFQSVSKGPLRLFKIQRK